MEDPDLNKPRQYSFLESSNHEPANNIINPDEEEDPDAVQIVEDEEEDEEGISASKGLERSWSVHKPAGEEARERKPTVGNEINYLEVATVTTKMRRFWVNLIEESGSPASPRGKASAEAPSTVENRQRRTSVNKKLEEPSPKVSQLRRFLGKDDKATEKSSSAPHLSPPSSPSIASPKPDKKKMSTSFEIPPIVVEPDQRSADSSRSGSLKGSETPRSDSMKSTDSSKSPRDSISSKTSEPSSRSGSMKATEPPRTDTLKPAESPRGDVPESPRKSSDRVEIKNVEEAKADTKTEARPAEEEKPEPIKEAAPREEHNREIPKIEKEERLSASMPTMPKAVPRQSTEICAASLGQDGAFKLSLNSALERQHGGANAFLSLREKRGTESGSSPFDREAEAVEDIKKSPSFKDPREVGHPSFALHRSLTPADRGSLPAGETKPDRADKLSDKRSSFLHRKKEATTKTKGKSGRLYTFLEHRIERTGWDGIECTLSENAAPTDEVLGHPAGGWILELGSLSGRRIQTPVLEDTGKYESHFEEHFHKKDCTNYIGCMENKDYIIISISKPEDTGDITRMKAIIRTPQGDTRVDINRQEKGEKKENQKQAKRSLLKELQGAFSHLSKSKLYSVDKPSFSDDLLDYEKKQVVKGVKFGILYRKHGQTNEEDMFTNGMQHTSPKFSAFLKWLGDQIPLKGFTGFRGGLDVKSDTTGTHSVHTKYGGVEIMFHVAPMLPHFEKDIQQVEKKRHLGNDIVCIIFNDTNAPFSPHTIKTEFNHVYAVIQPCSSDPNDKLYKFGLAMKQGVPPFGPLLPIQSEWQLDSAFRDFFLTKLMNGERASFEAPQFAKKMERTRRVMLEAIAKQYPKKKE